MKINARTDSRRDWLLLTLLLTLLLGLLGVCWLVKRAAPQPPLRLPIAQFQHPLFL